MLSRTGETRGRCFYCDTKLVEWKSRKQGPPCPPNAWTRDHVFPRESKKHQMSALNTVDACSQCNSMKGHLDPLDWLVIMPDRAGAHRLKARLYEMGMSIVTLDEHMARRRK